MANRHLFLPSGFLSAPLQNGVGRYIGQLQRVTLKFCKNHGSSKGMRDFIEKELLGFAKEHPGVVVYVKPRRHRSPVMVGEYLNGDRYWISCHDYTADKVRKWLDLMRTQSGNTSSIRLRKNWHTDMPSIQGVWSPMTYKSPAENLIVFPDEERSNAIRTEPTATEKLLEIFEKSQKEKGT